METFRAWQDILKKDLRVLAENVRLVGFNGFFSTNRLHHAKAGWLICWCLTALSAETGRTVPRAYEMMFGARGKHIAT